MRHLLLATLVLPTLALAQGALLPPASAYANGAPAKTMKTLAQLEPRTPVQYAAPGVDYNETNGGYIITAPGSYYLTSNHSVGRGDVITIASDNVTLDLNGFTLSSTASPAAGTAIAFDQTTRTGITIRNGHISSGVTVTNGVSSGPGFQHGIFSSSTINNCLVSDITICGTSGTAIFLDSNSSLERCVVRHSGGEWIIGQSIANCSATDCAGVAISGTTVSNCEGSSYNGYGIRATKAATNCSGASTNGTGLFTTGNAANCYGSSSSATTITPGLRADGTASYCRGKHVDGTALEAVVAIACTAESGTITATSKFLCVP